jgi:hypothetical protein
VEGSSEFYELSYWIQLCSKVLKYPTVYSVAYKFFKITEVSSETYGIIFTIHLISRCEVKLENFEKIDRNI